jgi:hypothetical protein
MLASITPTRRTALLAVAALGVGLLIVSVTLMFGNSGIGIDALNKAGLKATNGAITQLKPLFDMLKDNLMYVAFISLGAIVTFLGLLFMFGSRQATDRAIQVGSGVAIIIAVPGILA